MCRRTVHSGVMSDTVIEERTTNPKADEWAERIAAQRRSGLSVKQFCKEQGLTEYSFYAWRKRLQQTGPLRFALVDRSPAAGRARHRGVAGTGIGCRRASGCGSVPVSTARPCGP